MPSMLPHSSPYASMEIHAAGSDNVNTVPTASERSGRVPNRAVPSSRWSKNGPPLLKPIRSPTSYWRSQLDAMVPGGNYMAAGIAMPIGIGMNDKTLLEPLLGPPLGPPLGPWARRFLLEHLIAQRHLTRHHQHLRGNRRKPKHATCEVGEPHKLKPRWREAGGGRIRDRWRPCARFQPGAPRSRAGMASHGLAARLARCLAWRHNGSWVGAGSLFRFFNLPKGDFSISERYAGASPSSSISSHRGLCRELAPSRGMSHRSVSPPTKPPLAENTAS